MPRTAASAVSAIVTPSVRKDALHLTSQKWTKVYLKRH
jgi:hypothetical protein